MCTGDCTALCRAHATSSLLTSIINPLLPFPPLPSPSLPFPSLPFSLSPSAMSDESDYQRGHARHDTALIHGLSQAEVQKLSASCVEAKSRAYCEWQHGLILAAKRRACVRAWRDD